MIFDSVIRCVARLNVAAGGLKGALGTQPYYIAILGVSGLMKQGGVLVRVQQYSASRRPSRDGSTHAHVPRGLTPPTTLTGGVLVQVMLGTTSFLGRCERHWVMYSWGVR